MNGNSEFCAANSLPGKPHRPVFPTTRAAAVLWALFAAWIPANSAETVQPGIVLHDTGKPNITLSAFRSGEICSDVDGSDNICNTGTSFTVLGHDTCIGDDGKAYPCTRYGYRYDYAGATPGTEIECTATRRDPFRQQQKSYAIAIDKEAGTVLQPEWIGFGPVERRAMLTEVHECTYLGAPLATIEYLITYEPSADPSANPAGWAGDDPHKKIDEPYSKGVPNACNYLTQDLANLWVQAPVLEYIGANEHMPILRSHCAWYGEEDLALGARMEHKYHLYELFDVDMRSRDQLLFHATFAAGGHAPVAVRTDLGKITFVYELASENRSAISVVTGIQGPPDGAGRPMELLAHYQLRTDKRTHQQRLDCLFDLARKSLALWMSLEPDADGRIDLPNDPPPLGAACPPAD